VTLLKVHRSSFAVLLLSGCATFSPRLGFDEIEQEVSKRTSAEVVWHESEGITHEIELKSTELLSKPLTVSSAIQIALLRNPSLQALYEELDIAQASVVSFSTLRNPELDAEVRFGPVTPVIELSLVQNALDLILLPLKTRIGEAQFKAAKLSVTGRVLDVIGEVRDSYFRLQAAEEQRGLNRKVLDAWEVSSKLADELYRAGNATKLEKLNEQATFEEAKTDLLSSEIECEEAREDLNGILGMSYEDKSSDWQVEGRLPALPDEEIDFTKFEELALAQSIDLEVARAEIDALALRLGLERPSLLFGSVVSGVSTEREDGTWSTGPSLSIQLPIFNLGRPVKGGAEARLRAMKQSYNALVRRVYFEARKVRVRVVSARARARNQFNVVIPVRRQALEETQKHYNAMLVGAFQLLQAKQAEINSGRRYILELLAYWKARADAEQLLSGRMPRSERRTNVGTLALSGGNETSGRGH